MTLYVYTIGEKLNEVERLISEQQRHLGRSGVSPILKAIAQDLRAQLDKQPSETIQAISHRLQAVRRTKTALGYNQGAMLALAEEVIGKWPVLRAGLVMLEANGEKGSDDEEG